jgi:hypothetical protein
MKALHRRLQTLLARHASGQIKQEVNALSRELSRGPPFPLDYLNDDDLSLARPP